MKAELEFSLIECAGCFIPFYVPNAFKSARINDRQSFYCPHGHQQNYKGKSEAEVLKDKLQSAERSNEFLRNSLDTAERQRDEAEGKLKTLEKQDVVVEKKIERRGRKPKTIIKKSLSKREKPAISNRLQVGDAISEDVRSTVTNL